MFPPTVYEGSPFSTSLPIAVICVLFDDSHSGRCKVMSHCDFDLHFLKRCLFRYSAHFWIGSFFFLFFDVEVYELFIYVRYPLLVTLFANIFSYSVGCLFVLFKVSLAIQKLLSLIWSHLFIFYFISFVLEDRAKKYCYNLCQIVFCLYFLIEVL